MGFLGGQCIVSLSSHSISLVAWAILILEPPVSADNAGVWRHILVDAHGHTSWAQVRRFLEALEVYSVRLASYSG